MNRITVRATTVVLLATCIGLATHVSPAAAGLLSATRDVIAIVDGELFVGKAVGHLDGAGTIAIHSQKNPALSCVGEFTSSVELGGKGSIRCTDGATANFRFERHSTFRGHGAGTTSRGDMSFAYGLSAEEAAPYLKLPDGKKFSLAGTQLTLIDQ
jgi:hypothetical protein